MKKFSLTYAPPSRDIVFMPALTPMEAAVLPAREKRSYGALHHAQAAFRLAKAEERMRAEQTAGFFNRGDYRQKI